jgi:hypothetical protein
MKKKILSIVTLALVAIALSSIALSFAAGNNNPNKLWGAPSYLVNIIGKKADFNGAPDYDASRRSMFVPEDVAAWKALSGYPNATIWVSQANAFAVTDPNMFDDGQCSLTIAPGKYEVYFVALGKPGMTATLEGWVYNATDSTYLLKIGDVTVTHSKKPNWASGHDMFYVTAAEAASIGVTLPAGVSEMWIFDFLSYLSTLYPETSYLYLWNLIGGAKHIQVRFYKV